MMNGKYHKLIYALLCIGAVASVVALSNIGSPTTQALFMDVSLVGAASARVGKANVQVVYQAVEDAWVLTENESAGAVPVEAAPTVKNTGEVDVWVRVTLSGADGRYEKILLNDGWADGGANVFYYADPLKPGECTSAVYSGIVLKSMDGAGDFDLAFFAEAVQTGAAVKGPLGVEYILTAPEAFAALDEP